MIRKANEPQLQDEYCSAMFTYGSVLRELILRAKFQPDEAISRGLARFAYHSLSNSDCTLLLHSTYDHVTYVPSHWRRRLRRAHELPALLAQSVSRARDLTFSHLLTCTRYDPPLSASKSVIERRSNTEGRYALKTKIKPNSSILIVDDVVTTGTTLSACAKVFEALGHKASCFAFAKTNKLKAAPLNK